jgi:hypothetical protein
VHQHGAYPAANWSAVCACCWISAGALASGAGTGSTTFNGALALSGNSDGRVISGATVNFAGTTTWSNSPGGDNAFGAINTSGQAVLNNTGTWLDQNSSNPTFITNALSTFNNSGSYLKSGTAATTISGAFNNAGLLEVDAGELLLHTLTESDGLPQIILAIDAQSNNVLDVGSAAVLYGLISLDFDFRPTIGEVITVFDYGSHTGSFSSVTAAGLAQGLTLTPVYNGTDFQVIVGAPVPIPAPIGLLAAGLVGLILMTHRRARPIRG